MRKSVLLIGAAVLSFGVVAAHEAQAQPYWRGGGIYRGGWRGGGYSGGWRRGGWYGGGGAVAAGLIGGALIGGLISSAAAAPYYGSGYGYPYNYRYGPTYPYAGASYGTGYYGSPYYGDVADQEMVYDYPVQQAYDPAPVYRTRVVYYPRPVYRTRVVYRQAPIYQSRRVVYGAPVYGQDVVRYRPRARVVYTQPYRQQVISTGSINGRRDLQRARVIRRTVY
jgi:hypothetical protein